MADQGSPLPPESLLAAGPAPDVASSATLYTVEKDLGDLLAWMEKNAERGGAAVGAWWDNSDINPKNMSLIAKTLGWILKELATVELTLETAWLEEEAKVYNQVMPDLLKLQQKIEDINTAEVLKLVQAASAADVSFGTGELSDNAKALFNAIVQPFTLMQNTLDPSVVGSGIQNQQFLLANAMNLAVTEQLIDNAADHMGMGFLKTLQPFIWLIDRTVVPHNVARQATEASYAFLLKAPLTRDLNRKFPIKDLGLTALAHLYLRGAIDRDDYVNRCKDSGLNELHADQLLLEAGRKISEADIGKLYTNGIITHDDAVSLLRQSGYDPRLADTIIHLRTHDRNEAVRERVGYAAVSAWVRGKLDKSTMEAILQQTGFTDFEITTLELEQDFLKTVPDHKPLTYSDVKRLFESNIIGIDEVIAFLEAQNYAPADVQNLVLLDFTIAAERQARTAVFIARQRVAAQTAKVQAAAETKLNETALANAKKTLASELDSEAATLGQLSAVPGILALTGHIP